MATITELKHALEHKASATTSSSRQPLSDNQYSTGFDILKQGSESSAYEKFIITQLSQLLSRLLESRACLSMLEIGPGPESVLGHLSSRLRRKITRYSAFEPNSLFFARLKEWLHNFQGTELPLSCLEAPPALHQRPFALESTLHSISATSGEDKAAGFDMVLFCHSMYGMKSRRKIIEKTLELLVNNPKGGMVVVFHRNGALNFEGLVHHQTASFPSGQIRLANKDADLDAFSPFVAGYVMQDKDADDLVRKEWRQVLREFGRHDGSNEVQLVFSSPEVMVTFNQHATKLPELTAEVPVVRGELILKNPDVRQHRPAILVRPTEIRHVQQCVHWAIKHDLQLTILGGSHSDHCVWPNVVAVDMSAFNQIQIISGQEDESVSVSGMGARIVVGAGCRSGDIIQKAMESGLTVPLGSRPSVGAGLWLSGGIGHLSRVHGLTSDAIKGAVLVSVSSGQILYIGDVPGQHRPRDAIHPENEDELLWAIRGAGTNFGIIVSVTFQTYIAPTYSIRNWVIPLQDDAEARLWLHNFDELLAKKLPRSSSADSYLYWEADQLHLGITLIESSVDKTALGKQTLELEFLGSCKSHKIVDGVGLFDTEMYMSEMHSGNSARKTSAFKRGPFLKHIGTTNIANILIAAIKSRPTPFCYIHLLQGGGAIGDHTMDGTAFGCRDWEFECVVTGIWSRHQDGTSTARVVKNWVYDVMKDLLPLSNGVYSADLGPDPRDIILAEKAFASNRPRLAHLKTIFDPHHVLAYTCPLPKKSRLPRFIILVTGQSCVGKDHFARTCVPVFESKDLSVQIISISDTIKGEYAAETNTELIRLLHDRAYKEQHRPALTAFFQAKRQQIPQLPQENFLGAVYSAEGADVLLITGMRDDSPITTFSQLIPESRMIEVRVEASQETRTQRGSQEVTSHRDVHSQRNDHGMEHLDGLNSRPTFIFENDKHGDSSIVSFVESSLLPYFHEDLWTLGNMVRQVPDFPRTGIEFRHVLEIAQQKGGLKLCTSLLRAHAPHDWSKIDRIVCCEAGGFLFASVLALQVDIPLVIVREAGKLPPPTISVTKSSSHVSYSAAEDAKEKRIEMDKDSIANGDSVILIDDVLATGKTLLAVLQLLGSAGVRSESVSVLVVAEFPIHRGRELLRRHGFGGVGIKSLLVYGGY
ncbi:phosphoribosyl transferase domain protein [Calycina marina]|uniref:Phosphoribosyl transferase domain protein n=1 Tax=Calycina marina TaxID=1763456 RepID=A0A9P8CGW5_9HELO|nr:phosphoribosyl transferase domain protein [Calycina marina]